VLNDSISFGGYKRWLVDLSSNSWPFLLRIHPSEPCHSSLTHLSWLIHHLVRLESIQVHCFEWLHLEALGDCVSLRDLLVTLGVYQHLTAWSSEDRWAEGGACLQLRSWWLWGVLEASLWEITKGIFSRLVVVCGSLSCVGCAAPGYRLGVWCLLAREPPSGWIATTRTSLPISKWTSVKNHYVKLVFIVIDFSLAGLGIKSSTSIIFTFLVISCVEVA
jgi:hypothetical protein